MKSPGILFVIIFISLLLCSNQLFSQTPTPPVITEVSVIKGTNDIKISWTHSDPLDIQINVDYPDDPSTSGVTWIELDTVDNSTTNFYIHSNALNEDFARLYTLKTINPLSGESEKFPSTKLYYHYDTCNNSIQLNWNHSTKARPYDDERDVDFTYEIFRNRNSEGEVKIYPTDASEFTDTTFIDTDIDDNTNYEYHIKSIPKHSTSVKSTSNYITLITDIEQSPDYINALSASANGNNTDLVFEIAANSEIDQYKLLRSDSPTGTFDTLETIISNDFTINASDNNSNPDENVNYYKLVSLNKCNQLTTHSDVINNIVLTIDNDEYINKLSWNLFKHHDMVSATYDVYRSINDQPAELIRSISNFNSLTDNIESLSNQDSGNQFCYYIQAQDNSDFGNNISQSNTVCIFLEPKIYIPEGFTPNGDGRNDYFIPKFSFIPLSFEMMIYNRWGNMIFETKDYQQGWDGSELNSKSAPTGTYIYVINIKLPDNRTIEKRGNVTVIYP